MKPRVLILRTAGINCDKETEFAFQSVGAKTDLVHINQFKKSKDIFKYQIICVPGGFSYGDDLGAGKIFSLELLLWFKEEIQKFIAKGGLMLGICNGFQVLTKTGILPDLDFTQKVTLSFNDSGRFEDRWVYLKSTEARAQKPEKKIQKVWTRGLPEVISLPIAHGEGKFIAPKDILEKLEKNGQVAFCYCDGKGKTTGYPVNPNGSFNDIAGITDLTGRILGLMPHPERGMFKHHLPGWQDKNKIPFGLKIFANGVEYFK